MPININPYLEGIAEDLREAITRQGLTSTGKARASIKIRNNRNIIAVGYISTLFRTVGRKPGKRPPIANIEEYVKAKPLRWSSDSGVPFTSLQMAFMIAKTIEKRGTRIYRDHRRGIQIQRIIQNNNNIHMPRIARELKNTYVKEFNLTIVT